MKFPEKNIFRSFRTDAKDLSVFRIIFCLYILCFKGLPSFAWLGSELDYYFNPPPLSIANLFSGFLPRWFFFVLTAVNVSSFFCIFCGLQTKWSSVVFTCSYILGSNFVFSFGKIDHGILQYYLPLFMSVLGWGEFYSMDSWLKKGTTINEPTTQQDYRTFVLALFALLIGFGFFSAGALKVYGGWWKWNIEAAKYWLYNGYYAGGRTKYLAHYVMGFDNHLFWKMQDYGVLLFELGFLASAIHMRTFRFFLASALLFHCLVLLIFNINFSGNLIAYLAFADWKKIRLLLKKIIPRNALPLILKTLFIGSFLLFLFWVSRPIINPFLLRLPSLMDLLFGFLHLPVDAEAVVFFFSIPVLLLLVVLHFRKIPEPSA